MYNLCLYYRHIEKLHPDELPVKNNPFDSSDSESSPDQEKVRYKTRSMAQRTGAADDTGNDYDDDLPSEISGLDSSFTAKHYLSVNLRDMANNYDVSNFIVNIVNIPSQNVVV